MKLLLNITLILTTLSLTANRVLFNGKNLDGWNIGMLRMVLI